MSYLKHDKSIISLRHNQGVALLMVLPIVAIISALIYFVAAQEKFVIQRIEFQVQKQKLISIAEAGESYALDRLLLDAKDDKEAAEITNIGVINLEPVENYSPDNDSKTESWAQTQVINQFVSPEESAGGINHEMMMTDLDRFFNINNLHTDSTTFSRRLLLNIIRQLGIFESAEQETELTNNIRDWLDTDNIQYGKKESQTEKEQYEKLQVIHQPPNRQISHISELQHVAGMTDEILSTLSGHIQAFPIYEENQPGVILFQSFAKLQATEKVTISQININTCSSILVNALVDTFLNGVEGRAADIIALQGQFSDKSNSEYNVYSLAELQEYWSSQFPINSNNEILFRLWTNTHSRYFVVQNFVKSDSLAFNLLSYVYRNENINPDQADLSNEIWVFKQQLAWNKLRFDQPYAIIKDDDE